MKKVLLSILLTSLVILSGCLTITDEIFLDKDGSGKYATTIDMSKLKEMMDMLKTMAPDTSQMKMDDLKELDSLQNIWKDLETIPGISDVKRNMGDKYVMNVSFRFANIAALNEAMSRRSKKEDQPPTKSAPFYSFTPGAFSCNDTSMASLGSSLGGLGSGKDPNDSLAMAMTMLKGMMGDMTYTTVYHLPGKVGSVSNKQAKVSEDGKTVTLKIELMASDIPQTLQNEIRYQK